MRAKITIAFLSISLLTSFGLASNQAFAGNGFPLPTECEDCAELQELFDSSCLVTGNDVSAQITFDCNELFQVLQTCQQTFCAVGGTFEGVDTTSLLVSGAQMNAAWMIPVIVAGIGIAIVIARKF